MRGRTNGLVIAGEFLEELLAGTGAGKFDVDVLARLKPAAMDQILRINQGREEVRS